MKHLLRCLMGFGPVAAADRDAVFGRLVQASPEAKAWAVGDLAACRMPKWMFWGSAMQPMPGPVHGDVMRVAAVKHDELMDFATGSGSGRIVEGLYFSAWPNVGFAAEHFYHVRTRPDAARRCDTEFELLMQLIAERAGAPLRDIDAGERGK